MKNPKPHALVLDYTGCIRVVVWFGRGVGPPQGWSSRRDDVVTQRSIREVSSRMVKYRRSIEMPHQAKFCWITVMKLRVPKSYQARRCHQESQARGVSECQINDQWVCIPKSKLIILRRRAVSKSELDVLAGDAGRGSWVNQEEFSWDISNFAAEITGWL